MIKEYSEEINADNSLLNAADDLVAVNFSLWRAVLLTDLEEGTHKVIPHAISFMEELIENNIITYSQDKGSREWSFCYYMINAKFRLEALMRRRPDILSVEEYGDTGDLSDKKWWSHHQRALNRASRNMRSILAS